MSTTKLGSTLIIIPTYNERDTLETLVNQLLDQVISSHILIVDDGSPDRTGERAEEIAAREPRVHVLHRPSKMGMGTAYVAGFEWAVHRGFRQVAQIDADGSHDPGAVVELVERLEEADLVIGSRFIPGGRTEGWGAHRMMLSRMAGLYCSTMLGWRLGDPTSGFRALGPRALDVLMKRPVRAEGFAFQIEVAYRVVSAGLSIVEHPIIFRERAAGKSKLSLEIIAEAIATVPLLRLCSLVGAL